MPAQYCNVAQVGKISFLPKAEGKMIDIIRSMDSAPFLQHLVHVRLTDVVIILERTVRCSDTWQSNKHSSPPPLPSPFQWHLIVIGVTPLVHPIISGKRTQTLYARCCSQILLCEKMY